MHKQHITGTGISPQLLLCASQRQQGLCVCSISSLRLLFKLGLAAGQLLLQSLHYATLGFQSPLTRCTPAESTLFVVPTQCSDTMFQHMSCRGFFVCCSDTTWVNVNAHRLLSNELSSEQAACVRAVNTCARNAASAGNFTTM